MFAVSKTTTAQPTTGHGLCDVQKRDGTSFVQQQQYKTNVKLIEMRQQIKRTAGTQQRKRERESMELLSRSLSVTKASWESIAAAAAAVNSSPLLTCSPHNMLALFNSAGWQSNATQRVCCIYLNFIFILFISNLFHFLPLQSIVCRVRRWTSLGSLRLLKKKKKTF